MAESLTNRTIKGVGWSAADAFLGQGVTFLVGIILARLLSPAEYGLIGICSIFIVVLTGIVDSGFSTALIRKQDTTDDDYNTMFITNLVISIILFFCLYGSAPFVSQFFSRPELTALVRVMGLILIIQALSITQVTILTKRIDFKTKTKASLISAVTSGIIGVGMAFMGYGVWALVGQQLSRQVLYTLCLWIFNRWLPYLRFNRDSFHYMWGFGWKMMLSGLLNNIWSQLYQVVVGKYYSPATLGQYTRANEYASLFSMNFTSIIQRVTYPALSEVQNNKERMVAAYRRVIKLSMFVAAVCMISLGAVSEPFIYCIIGPQWHMAATFLPFICLSMSLYPLHAINLNMLQVQGRSDIFLILEIIKKIVTIFPLALGIFVDIYWMLIGSIFTGIIFFYLNTYHTGKELGYTSWMQIKDISRSYGVAFAVSLSVYFLKFLPFSNWVIFPTQVVVGSLVLILICEIAKIEEYMELKGIASSALGKFMKRNNKNDE